MQVRNSITLIGHLGKAPETFTSKSGTPITKFSLATNDSYRDREGNRVTRTDWHEVVAFGKLAEIFRDNLEKGSGIALVGTLRYHKWTDQHDQKRQSAQIHADSFTFLGTPQREGQPEPAPAAPAAGRRSSARKATRQPALVAEPGGRYGEGEMPF